MLKVDIGLEVMVLGLEFKGMFLSNFQFNNV